MRLSEVCLRKNSEEVESIVFSGLVLVVILSWVCCREERLVSFSFNYCDNRTSLPFSTLLQMEDLFVNKMVFVSWFRTGRNLVFLFLSP